MSIAYKIHGQTRAVGDANADFLNMKRVGDLDVDLVVHAEVGCLGK